MCDQTFNEFFFFFFFFGRKFQLMVSAPDDSSLSLDQDPRHQSVFGISGD